MIATLFRTVSALLLICLSTIAVPAYAQPANVVAVDRWNFWGTTRHFAPDDRLPGETALRLAARAEAGEHWSSGAGLPIPLALKAGEPISATFWARADRPLKLPVTIQGGTPSYASFVNTTLDLTPEWKRFTVSGAAPSDFPAGSQSLTLMLGKAQADVTLGPVLFAPGKPVEAAIEAAFAGYLPASNTVDVRIPANAGVVLVGTLRVPRDHGRGPFPAAILLRGHGGCGRAGQNLLFDRLLADGIAVLEYDKRCVDQPNPMQADTLTFVEPDAVAAVAYLKGRSDIDGRRIALIGHSQGGVVGPAVAERDPEIAAVVTLAAPVGPRHEMFLNELRAKLLSGGKTKEAADRIVGATRRLMDAYSHGEQAQEIASLRKIVVDEFAATGASREQADGFVAVLDTPVTRSMYEVGPQRPLARTPVLAVFGSLDTIVTPDAKVAAKAALKSNPDATVIELPGLNHGLKHEEAASPNSGWPAPEVVKLIGDWLKVRLLPVKAASSLN